MKINNEQWEWLRTGMIHCPNTGMQCHFSQGWQNNFISCCDKIICRLEDKENLEVDLDELCKKRNLQGIGVLNINKITEWLKTNIPGIHQTTSIKVCVKIIWVVK